MEVKPIKEIFLLIFISVSVSGNVRSLSSGLWSLTHLTALHLGDNSLSRVPPEIAKLHNLVFLDLSSNKIRSLPAELGNMVSLRWTTWSKSCYSLHGSFVPCNVFVIQRKKRKNVLMTALDETRSLLTWFPQSWECQESLNCDFQV